MRHCSPLTILLLALTVGCAPLPPLDPDSEADAGSPDVAAAPPDPPPDTSRVTGDAPLPPPVDHPVTPPDAGAPSDAPPAPVDTPPPADTSALPPPDSGACPPFQQWRTETAPDRTHRCVCTPGPRTGFGCTGQDTDCDGREDILTTCGGQCTDTRNDPAHCGGCGRACGIGAVCRFGVCSCPAELTVCTNGCFAFPSNRERCSYCARFCLGTTRPDCCPAACAATTNCGG